MISCSAEKLCVRGGRLLGAYVRVSAVKRSPLHGEGGSGSHQDEGPSFSKPTRTSPPGICEANACQTYNWLWTKFNDREHVQLITTLRMTKPCTLVAKAAICSGRRHSTDRGGSQCCGGIAMSRMFCHCNMQLRKQLQCDELCWLVCCAWRRMSREVGLLPKVDQHMIGRW